MRIAAFQQLSRINSMQYYGSKVLEHAGFRRNPALTYNILIGVLSVVAVVALLNRFNRREMILFGFSGILIAHLMEGTFGMGWLATRRVGGSCL